MIQLMSPKNTRIVGTLEELNGMANLVGFERDPEGVLQPEWEGSTDIWWDGQRTVTRDGEVVYLDADGEEFKASECREEAE